MTKINNDPMAFWPSISDVRRACLEGAGLISSGEPTPTAAMIYGDDIQRPQMGLGSLLSAEELAAVAGSDEGESPPVALTDAHAAKLEAAIRAEGFDIEADPVTGDIRLARRQHDAAGQQKP